MRYFEPEWTLYDITERYPQTKAVFVKQGFSQVNDETKRSTFGKALQLDIALAMRQLDYDSFEALLNHAIEGSVEDASIINRDILKLKGLLPCPVRIPLQEQLDNYLNELRAEGHEVVTALKSASMGLDWIKEEVLAAKEIADLDDLYVSAGFDIFFEDAYFRRFIRSEELTNPISWPRINAAFHDDVLQLSDKQQRYGMIAVVPAVFLVNTNMLGNRPVPRSWKDLLDPVYARSVSLPVSDFDLFNAILLTLHKTYGPEAVSAMGRNMLQSMHPAQMVKSERQKENKPAVTIMPNFFTKMVKEGSAMTAVWPEDGAIISPIFVVGKRASSELQNKVSDFIGSKAVGEILSHQGLFPSLHPEVDNRLPENTRFMWLGWDFINGNNLNQRFDECNKLFNSSILE